MLPWGQIISSIFMCSFDRCRTACNYCFINYHRGMVFTWYVCRIRIVCVWQLPRLIGMAINAVEQRNSNGMVEIIDLHDTTDIGIHMELPRAKEIHEESVTDDNG